jgi:hypothetical protein
LGATGFDASTSGVRSSSARRRLTNVVFANRMNGGSCVIDWASAVRWLASASVVVARLWISPLRSACRWAMSETRLPDLTMKSVNLPGVPVDLAEQHAR